MKGGSSDKPGFGVAQEQKGREGASYHPDLSDLLLKPPQSTLIAPLLVVPLCLKGDAADLLRSCGEQQR